MFAFNFVGINQESGPTVGIVLYLLKYWQELLVFPSYALCFVKLSFSDTAANPIWKLQKAKNTQSNLECSIKLKKKQGVYAFQLQYHLLPLILLTAN